MSNNDTNDKDTQLTELSNSNRILQAQLAAHKDVIRGLQEENLTLRANFNLAQQYYQESTNQVRSLTNDLANANKNKTELEQKIRELSAEKDISNILNPVSDTAGESSQAA